MFIARAVCPDRAKTMYTIRWFLSSSYFRLGATASGWSHLVHNDRPGCTMSRRRTEPRPHRRLPTASCNYGVFISMSADGYRNSVSGWVASRCWTPSIKVWFSWRHADDSRYSSSLSMVMNSEVITVRVTNATPTTSSKYLSATKKIDPKLRYTKNLISKWFGSVSNACNAYDFKL